MLKKAIYLAPHCTVAYLELGALYEGRGDGARARQMRQVALAHLTAGLPDSLPDQAVLPVFEIAEDERPTLIEQLQTLLAESAPDSERALTGTRES